MNWGLLWYAIQLVVFWFFLFVGLMTGYSGLSGNVPTWQSRWAYGATFWILLVLLARILHLI